MIWRWHFMPVRRRVLPVALALLLALPATGIAQSRPIGTGSGAMPDIRATLGDCPAELLRRAWNEMLPLEAAAVEREVLALCTERSEAMARFLDSQSQLDQALALVRVPSPAPEAAASASADPDEGRMERLGGEIASLRARIARLEGQPELPETEDALAALREELAAAEAELAHVDLESALGADVPASGGIGTAEASPAADTEAPADPVASLPPPTVEPSLSDAAAQADADEQSAALSPPAAAPSGVELPADVALPPDTATEWTVIHAVRRDGGPWQVRLQGRRKVALEVAGPTPEDPYAIHWQPVIDPPVTLFEGEDRPDGLALLEVTAEGVRLADPALDGGPVTVPFAADDANDPGALEWDFELIRKDGS